MIDISTSFNEVLRRANVCTHHRMVQRRVPVFIDSINMGAAFQEKLHDAPFSCNACEVQRRALCAETRLIYVDAVGNKLLYYFDASVHTSGEDVDRLFHICIYFSGQWRGK